MKCPVGIQATVDADNRIARLGVTRISVKFDTAPTFGPPRRTLAGMQSSLSPRKSWVAVGVVCALSAAALLAGPTPSPTRAVGGDNPIQLHANPDLDSYAPHRK